MDTPRRAGDRYVEMAPLGAGGMGRVSRARDVVLGREVALKRIVVDTRHERDARRRALREARAGARFSHPRLVRIYDVWEDGDDLLVVMELHEGPSLAERIAQRGALGLEEASTVISQVADGLAAAHAAGLVHGDVKPANVILRADGGGAVLVDFGLAKLSSAVTDFFQAPAWQAPGGRSVERLGGTPGYVAPELVRGEPASPSSDQFALAVTAFECLTGSPPWPGHSAKALLAAVLDDAPALDLLDALPARSHALRTELARGLAREPADRYPDVRSFAEALARAARPSDPPPATTPSRRPPWVALGLGLLLLAAIAATVALR